MKKAWIVAAVGLLSIVFALGAVACSDDDDNSDGDGEPTTAATEPAGEATEPADGGEPGGFPPVVVTENATLGAILTTFDGYTVYTFDSDSDGTSTCTADCASTWPPLPSQGEPTGGDGVTGELAIITRDDSIPQVTYDGMPLYMFSGDPSPGDTNGDGVGGTWHVVTIP